jgi:hypothetical protein
MNRPLLAWVDTALALQEENRELRRLMTGLIVAFLHNRALHDMARGELRERFPDEETSP